MATTTAPNGFGRPAWDAIRNARQVHGWGLVPVVTNLAAVNTTSATVSADIFSVGAQTDVGYWKIEKAYFLYDGADGALHANSCSISIAIGGTLLTATPVDNTAVAIAQNTLTEIPIDGPEAASPKATFLENGDRVQINFKKEGTGKSYSGSWVIMLMFRHSPPFR